MTLRRLALALLVAGACRPLETAPSDHGLELPGTWSGDPAPGAGPGPATVGWWRSFEDGELDRLVDEALATNHDLAAAAARVGAARARARIEGAARLPGLDLSGNGSRQKQVFVGFPVPGSPGPLETTSSRYDAGLALSWEADLWGRLAAGHEAARAGARASAAEREAAALSLVGQVARTWFGLQEAGLQADLAQRTVDTFAGTAEIVRGRYQSGLVPLLDVRLAESDEASARDQLEESLRRRDELARRLEILLGRHPRGELQAPGDLPAVPPRIPVGLPAELLGRRADLEAARGRLLAADARLEASRASLLPRISLTATGGLASDELGDLLDGDFGIWSLLGNLTQPLFQGGRLRAGVDLAEAEVQEAVESYAARVLQALFEVEDAIASEQALAERQAHLQRAASAASDAARLADERYRSGLVDLLTVLEAQRRQLAAESGWLAARRQRLEARIDLHLALGGGFESPTPSAGPDDAP